MNPSALRAAAQRLDAAADLLQGALGSYLRALHFDYLRALHADADAGVRSALDHLVADVAHWQQTARETAAVLRIGAERYADAEARAAQALR